MIDVVVLIAVALLALMPLLFGYDSRDGRDSQPHRR
jgi:hypothetical protein